MLKNWQEVKLRDCLTIKHGRSQKEVESQTGKYPILGTGGQIGLADAFLYDKPSVLIGRKGTIDKPRFMDSPFWTVDTLFYSHIKDNAIAKFIYYVFLTINWYSYNEASGVPSLSASTISNIKLLLPSVAEQKRIVTVLEAWDEYLEKLDKKIELKKVIKKGLMQQLLTGKTRMPGFNSEWTEVSLGDVSNIKTGKKDNQNKVSDGEYPFFVRSPNIERINSYSFEGEAILVPGEGNIGKIFHYINGKFDYHQRVYKISDFHPSLNGKYAHYYFVQNFAKEVSSGSVKATVDSLRLPTFTKFKLQLPPRDEQDKIVQLLQTVDDDIDALSKKFKYINQQRKYLLTNLINGKIRTPENLTMPAKEVQYA